MKLSASHIYAIIWPTVVGRIALKYIADITSCALIVGIVMAWAIRPFTAIFNVNFTVSVLETQGAT